MAACRLPHPHSPAFQFLGVCTGCAVVLASLPSSKLHLHHPGAPYPDRGRTSSLFGLSRAPCCPHPGLPTGCGGREVERVVATRPTPTRAQALPLFFVESRLSLAPRKWRSERGAQPWRASRGRAAPGCPRPGLVARTCLWGSGAGGTFLALEVPSRPASKRQMAGVPVSLPTSGADAEPGRGWILEPADAAAALL